MLSGSAGIAFGITSALVRPALNGLRVPGASLAVIGVAAAGLLLEQSSYQSGRLGLAVAVVTVADPLATVAGGAVFLHQPVHLVTPWETIPAVLAVICGVTVLASRRPAPEVSPARPHLADDIASSYPVRTFRRGGLRLLIGTDTYPPHVNGAAYFTRRLALGLVARGHEVHVVCPSTTGQLDLELTGTVHVHRVRSMRTPFADGFRVAAPATVRGDVARVLDRVRPDVVHVQNHFLIGRVLCRLAGRRQMPLVATNHFMSDNLVPYLPLPTPIVRAVARIGWRDLARVFRPVQALTTPTPMAAGLLQSSGIDTPVEAVSNGIDLSRFRPRSKPAPKQAAKTILFVGRLDPEKRVDKLIDALPGIRATIDARLLIGGLGRLRDSLEERAVERGVAAHVDFLGFVSDDDLPDLYASAAVFCMLGTAELQSLATLEAMATGCPIVAADAMVLPHLCQHGRNGYTHPPGDVSGLAAQVTAVLTDASRWEQMSDQSLVIAAQHDETSSLHRFEEIYAEVTGVPVADRLDVPRPTATRSESVGEPVTVA